MKQIVLALLVLLASCGAATPATARTSAKGRAFHSTVELQTPDGRTFCSGVITDNVILTAEHCTDDGEVWVETISGSRFEVELLHNNWLDDVAILVPVDRRKLGKGVRIARKAPGFGDDVWVIGHSMGFLTYSLTRGVVSHPRRDNGANGGLWMQHDAGSVGGNSGGPVLNKRGQLVGITSFGYLAEVVCALPPCGVILERTHISGAVHLESIHEILAR